MNPNNNEGQGPPSSLACRVAFALVYLARTRQALEAGGHGQQPPQINQARGHIYQGQRILNRVLNENAPTFDNIEQSEGGLAQGQGPTTCNMRRNQDQPQSAGTSPFRFDTRQAQAQTSPVRNYQGTPAPPSPLRTPPASCSVPFVSHPRSSPFNPQAGAGAPRPSENVLIESYYSDDGSPSPLGFDPRQAQTSPVRNNQRTPAPPSPPRPPPASSYSVPFASRPPSPPFNPQAGAGAPRPSENVLIESYYSDDGSPSPLGFDPRQAQTSPARNNQRIPALEYFPSPPRTDTRVPPLPRVATPPLIPRSPTAITIPGNVDGGANTDFDVNVVGTGGEAQGPPARQPLRGPTAPLLPSISAQDVMQRIIDNFSDSSIMGDSTFEEEVKNLIRPPSAPAPRPGPTAGNVHRTVLSCTSCQTAIQAEIIIEPMIDGDPFIDANLRVRVRLAGNLGASEGVLRCPHCRSINEVSVILESEEGVAYFGFMVTLAQPRQPGPLNPPSSNPPNPNPRTPNPSRQGLPNTGGACVNPTVMNIEACGDTESNPFAEKPGPSGSKGEK